MLDRFQAVWSAAEQAETTEPDMTRRGLPDKLRRIETGAGEATSFPQTAKHDPLIRKKLQKMLQLPGVETEIAQLQTAVPHKVLLNADFTEENFKQHLLQDSYTVVHIASHGMFGDSASQQFSNGLR